MRRPLTAPAFSLAAGIALAFYIDMNSWHLCALCAGACLVFCAAKHRGSLTTGSAKRSRACMALVCCLCFAAGALRMNAAGLLESALLLRSDASQSDVAAVEGLVLTASFRGERWDLTVRTKEEKVLVRLDMGEEDRLQVCDMAGRLCRFTGVVRAPDGRRNFGCFDYALYLKGRGVRCTCEVSRYRAESGPIASRFLHALSVGKARFFDGIAPYMDRDSFSLLAGLMFGEKGYLDDEIYASFRQNGIAHILAVSGLHVGLVYAAVFRLLGKKHNTVTSLITAASILCYVCLSNFSISVLRAAFLILLRLLAFHLHRRYDLVNAASLAALIFLMCNPYQLFDAGFQLSYLAAFSLGVALPRMQLKALEWADRYKKGWIDDAAKVLLPCVAVQLGMTPLMLYHFLIFSPVSLLLNPFAVALAALLLPAGFILFFMQGLNVPLLSAAAAGPAEALAWLLLDLDRCGSTIGGSFDAPAPPIGMLCLYYGLFFYCFSEGRAVLLRKGKERLAAILCACMMLGSGLAPALCGIGCLFPWQRVQRDVVLVDVGQGDCIHIASGGVNALIDGGGSFRKNVGEDTLLPYLLKNGITGLELAVVTHPDQDHAKGIRELSQRMPIGTIVFPDVYINDASVTEGYRADRFVFAGRGDVIRLGNAQFSVLTPYRDRRVSSRESDANETCLTGMLQIGACRILLTADMTDSMERRLLADGSAIDADILKVAHHGSAYSSRADFVDAVSPVCALISCGRNNTYGHPAERVTDMLSQMGTTILRTDAMGAIGVTVKEDGSLAIENADGRVKTVLSIE